MSGIQSSVQQPPVHKKLWKDSTKRPKIGIVAPHYGMERVSYVAKSTRFDHVTLKRVPAHRATPQTFYNNTAALLNPSVDLVHTLNMLPFNGRRFITSFELEMPRFLESDVPAWQVSVGERLMASTRCRGLLALSEIAARLLREQYANKPEIANKVSLFRGAVVPSKTIVEERFYNSSGRLELLFVGNAAFRKGITAAIPAVEAARQNGVDAHLTVISNFEHTSNSYVSGNAIPSIEAYRQKIRDLPWITHFDRLPNYNVRELMRNSDLLLLPTLDETLGWVLVEAGLEGLAAVSTNVFAIPELVVNNTSGRLLSLALNEQRRWHGIGRPLPERETLWVEDSKKLAALLTKTLTEVDANRDLAQLWGQQALRRMTDMYHPEKAAIELERTYGRALQ